MINSTGYFRKNELRGQITEKRILVVFGTRPEAIKLCPLINELKGRECFDVSVCVTAQHREMMDQVLTHFGITADHDLDLMEDGQSLSGLTEKVLAGAGDVLKRTDPDLVIVQGDTTTAFAAALSAFYAKIPVAHVEAGLRTGRLDSPFPEEFNRISIDKIAELCFAPTDKAAERLFGEGKSAGSVFVTGNTVIDALKADLEPEGGYMPAGSSGMGYADDLISEAAGRKLVILTAHRRENLGRPMQGMFSAIKRAVLERDDVFVVCPVHKNPCVRSAAEKAFSGIDRIKLTEPIGVYDFHRILSECFMVLTDSGGIQEEAQYLGKPVLVMRSASERREGVEHGCLRLVGTEEDNIYRSFRELLEDNGAYCRLAVPSAIYGDGHASERIADILEGYLSRI